MSDIQIREAREGDFEFVATLMDDALKAYYDGDHRAHAERIFNTHISGGADKVGHFSAEQRMFILTDGEQPLGMINVVGKRQGTWKISPLIVAPEARGVKGCGSQLLAFAEGYARDHGARQMYCAVAQQNKSAYQFFRRKGYHVAGMSERHYKPGVTEVMLYKPFADVEAEERIDRTHISVLPFDEKYSDQARTLILEKLSPCFRGVDDEWVNALCQFLAAPGLGMLSDRFGRRPILLISLLGSAVGYVLFGIGGALWVLFLSRVIDGLTGGNISTMFAYVADTTPPAERSKYYGMLGASIGFGFVIGPALGGLLSHISLSAPFFIAAAVMFVNGIWGYFVLPESVTAEYRLEKFELSHLNPFEQLSAVLKQPALRRLMLVGFLYFLPFAALQGNGSVLMKDVLGLTASGIGGVFFVIGVVDIGVQGFLMRKLLDTVNEIRLIEAGMLLMAVGFFALASLTWFPHLWILIVGVALFALGGGLFEPSFSGLISHAAEPRSQGRVQGANQSLQSLTRVIGPLMAAALYQYGAHLPYVLCMVFALAAFAYVVATRKRIVTAKPVTE